MICWRTGVLAALTLLGVVACVGRPPPRQLPITPTTYPAATEILAAFDQRWLLTETLRAVARVTVTSSQGRYSTRQTIVWRRPDLLRLDTLSLFGQPMMSLVADSTQASIYYPAEGTFFQGPASAETFARVIGLPLQVSELTPLLMGDIRPNPEQQVAAFSLQIDEGFLLLRFHDGEGQLLQDAWLDPNQLLPVRVLRYAAEGRAAIDIAYSETKFLTEGFPVPHVLLIWLPHLETQVRLQYLTVDLNPVLAAAVFQLSPPVGGLIRPLP